MKDFVQDLINGTPEGECFEYLDCVDFLRGLSGLPWGKGALRGRSALDMV